jgi:hypothetical protein
VASKVITLLTDDLDGSEAEETISFSGSSDLSMGDDWTALGVLIID